MRRRECRESGPGGAKSAARQDAKAGRSVAVTAVIAGATPAAEKTGVTFPPCAFTNWLRACEGQSTLAVRWWQQLCPGWGVATAIHICGHDRQFPQNSAATINVAMRMLEGRRILTTCYHHFTESRHTFRIIELLYRFGEPRFW